ncbi:MipA/OmpV family protein [Paenalcaligenes niemegkensis]|uniref:MipA/OmpV family protein n=1 Tax=Paenalcaligenes niemegkensis TaxID=2895469 RepID=UPI002151FCA0|nr:MipA/OmpV family protein [Paenalcaligenes niemegkensis]MCQ9617865.1 MipA/OmpV family protein [Paenalcaligenes niemegkensis]
MPTMNILGSAKRENTFRLIVVFSLGALAASLSSQSIAQTTIGAGVGFLPKYEGSRNYRARPFPLVIHRNGNFFIAPKAEMPAAGLQADLSSNWKVGVFGGVHWGRKASDDHRLYGTDRISRHAAAGVFTEISAGDFSFDATYYHALKDGYGGGLQLGSSYRVWQEGPTSFKVGGA